MDIVNLSLLDTQANIFVAQEDRKLIAYFADNELYQSFQTVKTNRSNINVQLQQSARLINNIRNYLNIAVEAQVSLSKVLTRRN